MEALDGVQRLVEGGDDEVLEHAQVVRVDGVGVDLERLDLVVAGDLDLDGAAAGSGLGGAVFDLFLGLRELLLHLGQLAIMSRFIWDPPILRLRVR